MWKKRGSGGARLRALVLAAPLLMLAVSSSVHSIGAAASFAEQGTAVGTLIRDFRAEDINGEERSFAQLRGKVTLVNFWATWCIPCRAEMPDLDALYHDHKDRGLVVIGIARDPQPGPVKEFLAEQVEISYPILMVDEALVELFGGVPGIPTTFVLDQQGVVREEYIGFRYRKTFEEAVLSLLDGVNRDAEPQNP